MTGKEIDEHIKELQARAVAFAKGMTHDAP